MSFLFLGHISVLQIYLDKKTNKPNNKHLAANNSEGRHVNTNVNYFWVTIKTTDAKSDFTSEAPSHLQIQSSQTVSCHKMRLGIHVSHCA